MPIADVIAFGLKAAGNRWVQLLCGCALAYGIGHHNGYAAKVKQDAAAAAVQVAKARQTEQKAATVAASIGQAVAAAQSATQTATVTIIRKVPVYVTKADDSRCVVNAGAISVLDSAQRGLPDVAADPAKPADAPSGYALSDVVSTDVVNAGYTHALEEQVNGLLDYYEQIRPIINGGKDGRRN